MRLGDLDALCQRVKRSTASKAVKVLAEVLINTAPTIDAVPVVRCRECVYKTTTACPAYYAPFMRTSLRIKFCSEGQRREAAHEVSE